MGIGRIRIYHYHKVTLLDADVASASADISKGKSYAKAAVVF
jgi:hypothetical protein